MKSPNWSITNQDMKTLTYLTIVSYSLILTLFMSLPVIQADEKPKELDVPQYLQDIAVTIRAATSEGSGAIRQTKDGQVWIWTCGHVVRSLRKERESPDHKTIIEFDDAKVVQVQTEDGRKVGESNFDAEVIRYSDGDHGADLALLRLRTKKFKPAASVKFYMDKTIPAVGAELLHCGSLLGTLGSNSITNGIVSQRGRVLNGVIYDQTNCATFPGSSGGIVSLKKDGRYIGMLVRGAGESFGLYIPIRRMREWAKKVGVEFAIDDSLPVPTNELLKKKPIDDSVTSIDARAAAKIMKDYPTKEHKLYRQAEQIHAMPDEIIEKPRKQ